MKGKKTTLRSGQEIWASGNSRRDMLPGQQTISVPPRIKRKKKKKSRLPLIVLTFLTLLTLLFAAGAWYVTKPQDAKPKIEKGDFYVNLQDNEMTVTWPEVTGADIIRLYRVRNGQPDLLCGEYTGNSAILSGIAPGELVYLRIEAVKFSENLLGDAGETVAKSKTLRIIPAELGQPNLTKKIDLSAQIINLNWDAIAGNSYELVRFNETGTKIISRTEVQGGNYKIDFNTLTETGGSDFINVSIMAIRKGDGYICTSNLSPQLQVQAKDLKGLDFGLTWERLDDRIYALHWQETKGDCCELQQWSKASQSWTTLKVVNDWSEDLTYVTDRLPSCTEVRFRLLAYEGDRLSGNLALEPSEISFWTDLSSLYCTVWPGSELKLYSASEGTDTLDKVPVGYALCVLGEENDRFYVRYNNSYGYVDSRYCLIDLPDYLGDLCEYHMTNSYQSVFKVHLYDIPEITSTVIPGYETVCLNDDTMLAPLLYPCAKRLETAARAAYEDGYRLRIYDAFRPHEATRFLFDTTQRLLYTQAKSGNWTNLLSNWDQTESKYTKASKAKELREEGVLNRVTEASFRAALTPEELELYDAGEYVEGSGAVLKESPEYSLYKEMVSAQYGLNWFLAQGVSTHNYGIALDLTLVNLETDMELVMQTKMHDLSWHSTRAYNTSDANLLSKYMVDVGFNTLVSEWWHFQDDSTRSALSPAYLEKGLSVTGWKRDDKGWKYRLDNGSYLAGVTATIGDAICTFNEDGYLLQ